VLAKFTLSQAEGLKEAIAVFCLRADSKLGQQMVWVPEPISAVLIAWDRKESF
jgi:hypothetical protein